jgi:hypothetical protein
MGKYLKKLWNIDKKIKLGNNLIMKIRYILLFIFYIQSFSLFATRQTPDNFIYNNREYKINENPMEYFFNQYPEKRPPFQDTGLYRGYIATFELINNELWVIDIQIRRSERINNRTVTRLISIIEECLDGANRIKIDWYDGILTFPIIYGLRNSNYKITLVSKIKVAITI